MRLHPTTLVMAIAVLLCGVPAAAQQGSLQGVVTSAATGSPLEAVTVILEAPGLRPYGTHTDRNGFYQIGGVEPGTYSLRGQQLGMVSHVESVTVAEGEQIVVNFRLDADVVAIAGIKVAPQAGAAVRDLGRQRVTAADIRRVPTPAGSGDLASYLQTLPGVVTTGDRGGQLYVRGGTAAENLVLVDGIPLYQPFHILGFFSVFPEDLVSSVDFYAGGFGAKYSGRTSSVVDVLMRDGNPNRFSATASVSPFLTEALIEGPAGTETSWIASFRQSLVDETSEALLGTRQPLRFGSQLFKFTTTAEENLRCSALVLHTSDSGRLDPVETRSEVAWSNLALGGRCVRQFDNLLRLLEVNFSYSSVDNSAVSRGSSDFHSRIWRMQHDGHVTSMIRSVPVYVGYHMFTELTNYDLTELIGGQAGHGSTFGMDSYVEASLPLAGNLEVRPGVVLVASPTPGAEPRVRASWEPFGRSSEKLQGAFGLYRQDIFGVSDTRDVGSVFTAWMGAKDGMPLRAMHALLGWQQAFGAGVRGSLEGYYKRMRDVPVPVWEAVARFTTRLGSADGEVRGADARIEYAAPHFYGFVGYGYSETVYETSQPEFSVWFGDSIQSYHPPHDRRHQVNAVGNLELGGFHAAVRWQLGTGLPFTRPKGFDEAFDFANEIIDVTDTPGTTRLLLDRPYTGRLPAIHRLDLSLGRDFNLPIGKLQAQVGVINAYDRRNMFYYDLFTGRRVDQLPVAPYASITVRGR